MGVKSFFKKSFDDMKESAKAQHEVDKAEFEAVKAKSKAIFEENRGHNTYAKAKCLKRSALYNILQNHKRIMYIFYK